MHLREKTYFGTQFNTDMTYTHIKKVGLLWVKNYNLNLSLSIIWITINNALINYVVNLVILSRIIDTWLYLPIGFVVM